ncbi:carbamoyltransferase [Desulfobacterota bacterium AH_259_B03_O07]|nr:carbamoyltransferase [Desulfobacterota bacterium AH_259_B03_O07]
MKILGISAFYHDSAAAIINNGEVIAAAQEERFTRKKHDFSFPTNAIEFCLKYSGLSVDKLDAIVFYDKPLLKFERLLETYYGMAPKGLKSFITAMPVWIKEKMFIKKLINDELNKIDKFDKKKVKMLFPEHHLSHAASAFYPSPFEEAAILTIDGVGEWATASICYGNGNKIIIKKELRFPHSLGLLYSAFTYFLGFKVNSGEYKLMGLAPYGKPNSRDVNRFTDAIKTCLIEIKGDGSIWLDQDYFQYATGLRMVNDKKWEKIFGFPRRGPETEILQSHCDLALAIQTVTEEVMLKMAYEAKRLTNARYLCMAGGVALNCVANGKILREKLFEDIFIQPAAGDAGGALGAALAVHYIYFNQERNQKSASDHMRGAFLGPEFSDLDIKLMSRKYDAVYKEFDDFDELVDQVSTYLMDGNAIGWFQGRMEFGPRALGNRSIIGDARNTAMQKKLNLKIKYRESFRPFAPSVLAEACSQYFELDGISPYMLLVEYVVEDRRRQLPSNYQELPLREKLYFGRSDIPAITHIDFSARIQTVHRETNERFWKLINMFQQKTGYGLIINTSFNVRGEPIVCTPEDAYKCFMRTEMDYLVLGDLIFHKKDQPEWIEQKNWKEEFVLD